MPTVGCESLRAVVAGRAGEAGGLDCQVVVGASRARLGEAGPLGAEMALGTGTPLLRVAWGACDLRAVITARAAPTRNLCPKCPRDGCPNSAPASKGPGDSPQAPEQPGKLQKTGVSGETELAFRQGQLAVLERVVRHSDAQGPAGEDGPGQPPPG